MRDGFIKITAVSPSLRVADTAYNAGRIVSEYKTAAGDGAVIVLMPELSVTGYTCGDLFLMKTLLDASDAAVDNICAATRGLDAILVVGAPRRRGGKLYNCAVVLQNGTILGEIAKYNIPNYGEFYEARYFTPNDGIAFPDAVFACENIVDFKFCVEICEDLWVPDSPSRRLCEAGATVVFNLSASDEVVGKDTYRRTLVKSASAKYKCAYVYCDAGEGESSGDLVYGAHNVIAELGATLAEARPFEGGKITTEVDLQRISSDRLRLNTFTTSHGVAEIPFALTLRETPLTRCVRPSPFVPSDGADRAERCRQIVEMQSRALAKRLRHGGFSPVIGVSGGLDSTLALLVCVRAMKILNRPVSDVAAITMPCFGTTSRTKNNAKELCAALGVTFSEIDITEAVKIHLRDIGHDIKVHDTTYENAQARERTQVLMDAANSIRGGIVIGTGDLSEMALGWSTYNGDQMSMYGVNCGVPKTLVRYLVEYFTGEFDGRAAEVLRDILDTPVSPELLPPEDGKISQRTEDIVGPYELHDFFLYYFLRFGFTKEKILRLALYAFGDKYEPKKVKQVEDIFFRRFFAMQFKRSATPDGPKIGSVALSPRGDWRMPSDACGILWSGDQ